MASKSEIAFVGIATVATDLLPPPRGKRLVAQLTVLNRRDEHRSSDHIAQRGPQLEVRVVAQRNLFR